MKLVVSDFDDTFNIDLNDSIESANKFMKQGNLFVIATGSSYQSYLDKVNNKSFKPSYLVLNHGSIIMKSGTIIYQYYVPNKITDLIYRDIIHSNYINYFFCNQNNRMASTVLDKTLKIHIEYRNSIEANSMKKYFQNKYGKFITVYSIYETRIEIVSNKSSKINAINKIIELEKINKDCVYTVGDSYSDLEMIKMFNGYAMKGSVPELKEFAKKEINSVSELIKEISSICQIRN